MDSEAVKIQRLIANLMSASAPVEEYLRQGKPLSPQELESLALTISGLQTFLEIWKRKHRPPLETKPR